MMEPFNTGPLRVMPLPVGGLSDTMVFMVHLYIMNASSGLFMRFIFLFALQLWRLVRSKGLLHKRVPKISGYATRNFFYWPPPR